MNAELAKSNSGTFRVLLLYGVAVLLACAVGSILSLGYSNHLPTMVAGVCGAVLASVILFVAWRLRRVLRASEIIEGLVSRFADLQLDPNDLPQIAAGSPAAAGWNQLAQAARRWLALSELERRVSDGLAGEDSRGSHTLLNSIPDGVAATDVEGKIVFANAAFASILSAERDGDLPNQHLLDVCNPPDDVRDKIQQESPSKRIAVEFPVVARGDEARRVRLTRTQHITDEDQTTGHVWLARDITQQRLAEEMRDKLLATATHELRTPLANLCAYAETLATMDDLDVESQKGFFNIIQSESKRLSQVVDELLDVSRMQAGALTIDRSETDLGRVVEEVSGKVEASMQSKNIEFIRELPPKYPKLFVDKSKLAAALVNLLGNAAKYTPDGGRVTFRVDIGEQKVEFSVADTGIGISAKELPRVFDRFFRSEDERVKELTGSGLGLSLSQEVARLHGGELNVESEPNVGSIFTIVLPIEDVRSPS